MPNNNNKQLNIFLGKNVMRFEHVEIYLKFEKIMLCVSRRCV
jgi:hypothetical protein